MIFETEADRRQVADLARAYRGDYAALQRDAQAAAARKGDVVSVAELLKARPKMKPTTRRRQYAGRIKAKFG